MQRTKIPVAVLLMAAVMIAGSSAAGPIVGAKLGLNIANWHGDDVASNDQRFGFSGGAYAILPVTEAFAFQAELLYTMKGTSKDEFGVETVAKLNYVEIPLLMRFDIPAGGALRPYMLLGPSIAFEVTSKIKENSLEVNSEDVCLDTKSPDTGIVFGVGAGFSPPGLQADMMVEIRYVLGLRRINDSPEYCDKCDPEKYDCYLGGPFDIKNKVITIALGMTIPM